MRQRMPDLEANKRAASEFLDLAFNQGRPEEAAARYLGPTYTQHNPAAADGAEAFVAFAKPFLVQFPELRLEIRRLIAEDEFVVVHALAKKTPGERGEAAMDIFRFENGKIVEHWDVSQPVPDPATSANPNGMF
jgi:predicted SnoaL-like aldol condensation-catalyzing enzyme